MYYIWLATDLGCVLLALLLIERKHYVRYGFLMTSAILAVIVDAGLAYVKHFHAFTYVDSRHLFFFIFLGVNLMVVFESWRWCNRWVMVPTEVQTALGIALVLARKYSGDGWTIYYMDCALRISNLLMILAFLVLFSRSPNQLREITDEPRTRGYEAGEEPA